MELDEGVGNICFVCIFVLINFFKNALGLCLELCNLERYLGDFVLNQPDFNILSLRVFITDAFFPQTFI